MLIGAWRKQLISGWRSPFELKAGKKTVKCRQMQPCHFNCSAMKRRQEICIIPHLHISSAPIFRESIGLNYLLICIRDFQPIDLFTFLPIFREFESVSLQIQPHLNNWSLTNPIIYRTISGRFYETFGAVSEQLRSRFDTVQPTFTPPRPHKGSLTNQIISRATSEQFHHQILSK